MTQFAGKLEIIFYLIDVIFREENKIVEEVEEQSPVDQQSDEDGNTPVGFGSDPTAETMDLQVDGDDQDNADQNAAAATVAMKFGQDNAGSDGSDDLSQDY